MSKLRTESIKSLFWKYSIPAIVASTSTSLYNIIDRIFIGQGVGPYAISGLALTLPLMNIAIALSTLIGAGAAAIISIRLGERRYNLANKTLGNATLLFFIFGGTFSILAYIFLDPILIAFGASELTLPYARDFMQVILIGNVFGNLFYGLYNIMRASGYPSKGMVGMIVSVIANLILAPFFIFVLHWGIRGAALATVLSQFIGLNMLFYHFLSSKHTVHYAKNGFKLSRKIIAKIFSIGLSPFLVHLFSFVVITVINRQLKQYGGDFAIGAAGIINSLAGLVTMIFFGFTQGIQPIVGYNYGAKQYQRMWDTYKLTVKWATIVGIVAWVVALLYPHMIAQAFTTDKELIDITTNGIRIYFLAFPFVGFQLVTSQFFLAIGKARISIFLSMFRQVIVLLPFLLILPPLWSVNGVWYSEPISSLFALLMNILIIYKWYDKQSWKPEPTFEAYEE